MVRTPDAAFVSIVLVACSGAGAGPEQRPATPESTVPTPRAAPTIASTTTVPPAPSAPRRPTQADPLRVLVLGDSVMYDATPSIAAVLESTGVMSVDARPFFGFGLAFADHYDWRRVWPEVLAEIRPEIAIVMVGAWDVSRGSVG